MKTWGPVATWVTIAVGVLVNLAQMAYVFGVLQGRVATVETSITRHEVAHKSLEALPTRVQFAEEALRRVETNVNTLSALMADVAVIKSEMRQLNENVKLLQTTLQRK